MDRQTIVTAHVPSVPDLARRLVPARALTIHTTSRGLTGRAMQVAGDGADLDELDEAAVRLYTNPRTTLSLTGGYLVGLSAAVFELVPDDRCAQHAGALPDFYDSAKWRLLAKPMGEAEVVRHGREPAVVWDWWDAQWPGLATPLTLPTGRSPNGSSIGIDVIPRMDGTYSPEQMAAVAGLVRMLCAEHGIPHDRRHVLAHCDIDPVRRGTVRRVKKRLKQGAPGTPPKVEKVSTILGVPWDPGVHFDWSSLGLAQAETHPPTHAPAP